MALTLSGFMLTATTGVTAICSAVAPGLYSKVEQQQKRADTNVTVDFVRSGHCGLQPDIVCLAFRQWNLMPASVS